MAIQSGIYMILNLLNGKRYIGSAVNLEGRWQDHFSALRRGSHHNVHLQRAFDKYGGNAFGCEVLKYVENLGSLILWEGLYLKIYWPAGLLYNHHPTAGSPLGFKWTEESKRRHSEALMGNRYRRGKLSSAETKQKQRKAMLKRWKDPEYRQNQLDTNPMLQQGYEHTEESKQKQSEAVLRSWKNPERRRLQREALTGEKNPMYGKTRSVKTRQKQGKAMKKYWARRKRAEHLLVLDQLVVVLQKRLNNLTTVA